jgi:hypothetical protein
MVEDFGDGRCRFASPHARIACLGGRSAAMANLFTLCFPFCKVNRDIADADRDDRDPSISTPPPDSGAGAIAGRSSSVESGSSRPRVRAHVLQSSSAPAPTAPPTAPSPAAPATVRPSLQGLESQFPALVDRFKAVKH